MHNCKKKKIQLTVEVNNSKVILSEILPNYVRNLNWGTNTANALHPDDCFSLHVPISLKALVWGDPSPLGVSSPTSPLAVTTTFAIAPFNSTSKTTTPIVAQLPLKLHELIILLSFLLSLMTAVHYICYHNI